MSQNVALNETASVVLDASGNGVAKIGPKSAREIWHPGNVHVNANGTPVKEAQCVVSVGDSYTRTFRDACVDGSTGDSTDHCNADVIKCGQYVWAEWTGGDAHVTAVLTVTGTRDV